MRLSRSGTTLFTTCRQIPGFAFHIEICEDLWVPVPPSTIAALAGATVLTNLSASNITIGKADYRRMLCASHSSRCLGAYVYAAAGAGESTTDLAWDGHGMIYENGHLLAETQRFAPTSRSSSSDIDLERLVQERVRHDQLQRCGPRTAGSRRGDARGSPSRSRCPRGTIALARDVERFPYVPGDPAARDERCFEAYNIQVQGCRHAWPAPGSPRR